MKISTIASLIGLSSDIEIIKCSKCSFDINVGRFSVTFGKPSAKRLIRCFFKPFQCQDCGNIKFEDPETNFPGELKKSFRGICVALEIKCDCGGQLRRDKILFCPNCHHKKSTNNKFYKNISIYKKTAEKLNFFE